MSNLLKIFFLTFLFNYSFSQNNFKPLDTLNTKEFNSKLTEFYKNKFKVFNEVLFEDISKNKKQFKEIYLEHQEEFLNKINKNHFLSDKYLNTYIENLLYLILDANQLYKSNYKILVSKDSDMNAYNTGDGTIVIHFGLINGIDNENELVAVICHEIGHQELFHVKKSVENYIQLNNSREVISLTKDIKKLKYNRTKASNSLILKLKFKTYSEHRKKEIEADSIGFQLYKRTKRDLKNTISLLEKLNNADKEKDSLTFEDYKNLFESDSFKVKKKYFEDENTIFNLYDKSTIFNTDSLKTHPDCSERIKKLQSFFEKNTDEINKISNFEEVKKFAFYQNLFNLYLSKEYGICLYESLKYFKKNKENNFIKQLIYLTFLEIKKSKEDLSLSKYIPSIDKAYHSKSLNQFISFINTIKISDINIINQKFQ